MPKKHSTIEAYEVWRSLEDTSKLFFHKRGYISAFRLTRPQQIMDKLETGQAIFLAVAERKTLETLWKAKQKEGSRGLVYLPVVANQPAVDQHGLSAEELALWQLVTSDPEQQHTGLALDYCLISAARYRSSDMATRNYFGHTDPDGITPNVRGRLNGCAIPGWYGDGNNIESIAAGYQTPEEVWQAWKASPNHRPHVLGEHEFFRGQTRVGIGFERSTTSMWATYWTLWFSHPDGVLAAGTITPIELNSRLTVG